MSRSYSSPPGMVMTVMSAVCVLLREHTDWTSIKLTMADPAHFMRRLAEYNKDKIHDKVSRTRVLKQDGDGRRDVTCGKSEKFLFCCCCCCCCCCLCCGKMPICCVKMSSLMSENKPLMLVFLFCPLMYVLWWLIL